MCYASASSATYKLKHFAVNYISEEKYQSLPRHEKG